MFDKMQKYPLLTVAVLTGLLLLPGIGLSLFNTKGEPREAIVAVSMLQQHNWILPLSVGGDIPYKPPFMAWLIAAISQLLGGHVTEFTSRLPSVFAAMVTALGLTRYLLRTNDARLAVPSAIVMITCFEVWRAATVCRVDMVLTACTVMAMFCLYDYITNRNMHGIPWAALAWMSMATLTKGPVGMVLPCLSAWLLAITYGKGLRATLLLPVWGAISLLLPAVWYWAAYCQGGEDFLNLVIEENFGRLTGGMSYESHVNPVWYNIITLAAGLLPYTLLAVLGLFTVKLSSVRRLFKFKNIPQHRLYIIMCALVVLLFYSIPKSKRSVYLLPMYPAMAYLLTLLADRLCIRTPKIIKAYAGILCSLLLTASLVISGLLLWGGVPVLCEIDSQVTIIFGSGLLAGISAIMLFNLKNNSAETVWKRLLGITYTALLITSTLIIPPVLNAKSDAPFAAAINEIAPCGTVYQHISDPMLRYYTVNFYIGDRIAPFGVGNMPEAGLLIADDTALADWQNLYGNNYSITDTVMTAPRKSCDTRKVPKLLKWCRNDTEYAQ